MAWAGRRWAEPPRLRRARRPCEVRPSGSGLRPDRREELASSAAAWAWRCPGRRPPCNSEPSAPVHQGPRAAERAVSWPPAVTWHGSETRCQVRPGGRGQLPCLLPSRPASSAGQVDLSLSAAPTPHPSLAIERQGPAGVTDRFHVLSGRRARAQLGRLHLRSVIRTRSHIRLVLYEASALVIPT